ncbi:MAG: hypothetical protein M0Q93_10910 [Terrimicrobiaceae bacterium]|nr:hypothetical protein [Terrimicrobiaceae bacterium]
MLVLQATGGATKAFAGPGDKDAMFDWTPTGAGTLVTYRGIYSFASHAWTLEARWKGGSTTFFSDRPVEFSPSDIGALAITLEHQMPTEGRAGHSKITDISLKIY